MTPAEERELHPVKRPHQYGREQTSLAAERAVGWEDGAKRNRAGALIYRDVRELQRALKRIRFSVFHNQLHAFGVTAVLQAFLFQAHEIITGFSDIHINGIELLYRRHRVSLTICHRGTFGHAGFADAAADWRRHFCVRQLIRALSTAAFAAITSASAWRAVATA